MCVIFLNTNSISSYSYSAFDATCCNGIDFLFWEAEREKESYIPREGLL